MLGPTATVALVIDADFERQARTTRQLADHGLGVTTAGSGLAGVEQAYEEACDLVIAFLPLPDLRASQFLTMIGALGPIPVLAVVESSPDVAGLLDMGAADAMWGEPSSDELAARARAVSRRVETGAGPIIEVGDLLIDPQGREVHLSGRPVQLTRKEFDLLLALAVRPGVVVSKRQLLGEVWDQPFGGPTKTVDVHLSWLRRKLGESANSPRFLRTVRGVGVKLVDPTG